jgi:glutathione S-transferase
MPKVKLTYFDFAGGRGEDCRLALHIAGVEFEDNRIQGETWRELKPSTPYGSLPLLEVDGEPLAQSNAILAHIGRRHDMHPTDSWKAAKHEAILNSCEELRGKATPVISIKDEEEKVTARKAFADDYLQRWGASMEKQIAGPFIEGDKISVADLKLYNVSNWFIKGGVDHISTDVFKDFPKLSALHQAVKNHDKVVEWYAR